MRQFEKNILLGHNKIRGERKTEEETKISMIKLSLKEFIKLQYIC
jgi:hypothetical protein